MRVSPRPPPSPFSLRAEPTVLSVPETKAVALEQYTLVRSVCDGVVGRGDLDPPPRLRSEAMLALLLSRSDASVAPGSTKVQMLSALVNAHTLRTRIQWT